MEITAFISLNVIAMFVAVAGSLLLNIKQNSTYQIGAISGFIIFILSIIIYHSTASSIIAIVGMFMLVFSLPNLVILHYQRSDKI